jgi:hypothetical protein
VARPSWSQSGAEPPRGRSPLEATRRWTNSWAAVDGPAAEVEQECLAVDLAGEAGEDAIGLGAAHGPGRLAADLEAEAGPGGDVGQGGGGAGQLVETALVGGFGAAVVGGCPGVAEENDAPGRGVVATRRGHLAAGLAAELGVEGGIGGVPDEDGAGRGEGEVEPLGGEGEIEGGEDPFEGLGQFGGLGGVVLVEEEDVVGPGLLEVAGEGGAEAGEVGVGERFGEERGEVVEAAEGDEGGVEAVGLVQSSDRLWGQAVLEGPPGGFVDDLGPGGSGGGEAVGPFAVGPVAGEDPGEVGPGEGVGLAGGGQDDRIAVELSGELEIASGLEAEPFGGRGGGMKEEGKSQEEEGAL